MLSWEEILTLHKILFIIQMGFSNPKNVFYYRTFSTLKFKRSCGLWRVRNAFTKRFTYLQHNRLIQRRSDYFLISDCMQDHTKYVDINPAINTDHSVLVLKFSYIKQTEQGPFHWKFNNSLLSGPKIKSGFSKI